MSGRPAASTLRHRSGGGGHNRRYGAGVSEVHALKDFIARQLMPAIWALEDEVRALEAKLTAELDRRLDAEASLAEMDVEVSAHMLEAVA